MKLLWRFLFGCPHHPGWPITLKGRTYQVCSKCGREFEYAGALVAKRRTA